MYNMYLIKDLCEQKGITLLKLAKDLGMSYTALHRIIRLNTTTEKRKEQIANYFGIDISHFLTSNKLDNKNYKLVCDECKRKDLIIDKLMRLNDYLEKELKNKENEINK